MIYTVKQGDTLYKIAREYGSTINDIVKVNGLDRPDSLVIGQNLFIPTAENSSQQYTVISGDSMYKIANKFGITLAELINANPQISNPNIIQIGQVINIPNTKPTIEVNGYAIAGINIETLDKTLPYLTYLSLFSYQAKANGELTTLYEQDRINLALSQNTSPIMVITNIGSSHLEALGSRENICRAKMEITAGLKDGGTLFLNGDEPLLQGHESDRYNVLYFGMKNEECDYFASNIRNTEGGLIFDMRTPAGEYKNIEINLAGSHNVYNAMVAFSVGIKMNMAEAEIREGLLSYKAAKMRQNIYSVGGITVIEDCYNASPESMNAAINVLGDLAKAKGGRMIALLGDMRELGATTATLHAGVGSYFASKNPDYLFTYGELSSENLADGAAKNGMSESKIFRNPITDAEAVGKKLLGVIKEGDILLVKASRGIAAENVLNYVKAQLA